MKIPHGTPSSNCETKKTASESAKYMQKMQALSAIKPEIVAHRYPIALEIRQHLDRRVSTGDGCLRGDGTSQEHSDQSSERPSDLQSGLPTGLEDHVARTVEHSEPSLEGGQRDETSHQEDTVSLHDLSRVSTDVASLIGEI
jgi:hypothetical protein